MTEKPRADTPGASPPESDAGRLSKDDRGNITWEWKDEGDLLADDTLGNAERIRALVDPQLQVKEEDDDPLNPIRSNSKGLATGYNPYNSGALGKASYKKKKDLHEFSKWIELRKKMAERKDEDEDQE